MKQQTKEWYEFRKNKIGASDAPVIMMKSPWKSPYQLWLEKMGCCEESFPTHAMLRGLELENKARESFEKEIGRLVFPKVLVNPEYEWQMASLDGISEDNKIAVEIKCPKGEDHLLALNGKIPEKYYPQLQHQIKVAHLDFIYYYSFDGENGTIVKVARNEKFINEMMEKEKEFWNCMVTFSPPELCDKDYIKKDDSQWNQLTSELKYVKSKISQFEEMESILKNKLISLCDGKNSEGNGIRVMKSIRKGNIDYSQINELKEIDLNLYRKPNIEYWKIHANKDESF